MMAKAIRRLRPRRNRREFFSRYWISLLPCFYEYLSLPSWEVGPGAVIGRHRVLVLFSIHEPGSGGESHLSAPVRLISMGYSGFVDRNTHLTDMLFDVGISEEDE